MRRLKSTKPKKVMPKLLVFLLIFNLFMFTNLTLKGEAYAAPNVNEMNVNATDNEISVSGTADGNGVDLADKPFRYSIDSSQSEWVRDSSNILINETLTSGTLNNMQALNNSLSLAPTTASGSGIEISPESGFEGYAYCNAITIDHTKVDSELTNFPATLYLDDSNFDFSKCKPDGSDIRFTDKNLNSLKFERVEHWFRKYLYNLGDEHIKESGGWTDGIAIGGTKSKNTDSLYIYTGTYGHYTTWRTANMIDLTNVDTLFFDAAVTISGSARINFMTSTNPDGNHGDYTALNMKTTSGSRSIIALDVSALTGSHYIIFQSNSAGGTAAAYLYGAYAEGKNLVGDSGFAKYNVILPSVSSIQDTEYYMWYGNPDAYNTSIEAWQDQTGKQLTYNGNVKLVPNVAKFGKAAYLDGSGDYLSFQNHADFDLGTGNFKACMWLLPTTFSSGTNYIFGTRSDTLLNDLYYLRINDTSGHLAFASKSGGVNTTNINTTGTLTLNKLQYVEVSKVSGIIYIFIDGVLAGSGASDNCPIGATHTFDIGIERQSSSCYYQGYMDDFIFEKGVGGHISNYEIPTIPHAVSVHTKLLLAFDDFDAMRIATSPASSEFCYFENSIPNVSELKNSVVETQVKYTVAGASYGHRFDISNGDKQASIMFFDNFIICNADTDTLYRYNMNTRDAYHTYKIKLNNTTNAEFFVDDILVHTTLYAKLQTVSSKSIIFGDVYTYPSCGGTLQTRYIKYNLDYGNDPSNFIVWNAALGFPSENGWAIYGSRSLATLIDFKDDTGKTLTTYGDVKTIKTPYADGARSAYFDGNGDYFSLAPSLLQFGSSNWTVEGMVQYNVVSGTQVLVNLGYNASNTRSFVLYTSDNVLKLAQSPNGSTNYDVSLGNHNMSIGNWYHFSVVRNGSTIIAYINGVSIGASIPAYTLYASTNLASIGSESVSHLNGYMSGVRITKGRARYTTNYIPPTKFEIDGTDVVFCTNFDTIYDQNYAMVQHMGDSLIDATGNGNNGTATGTTVVNTEYGQTRSINSATDVIAYASPILPIGDKTVLLNLFKRSIRSGNVSGNQVLLNTTYTPGTAEGALFEYTDLNNICFYMSTSNTDTTYPLIMSANGVPSSTWETVGLSYKNGTVANGAKLFAGGAVIAQATSINQVSQYSNLKMCGENRSGASSQSPDAIIGETRISNIARSDSWIKAESLSLKNELLTFAMYVPTGSRESEAYDISGTLISSRVDWTETKPTGTSITVESNVSLDGGSSWLGWKACTRGAIIADLDGSTDTSKARLKLRQTLSIGSSASTPILSNFIITIGLSKYEHRISAQPNQEYTVRFDVKDANGSITSETRTVYTKAQTPIFTVSNKTINSIDLIFSDINPQDTEYQILCDSRYVNSSGILTSVPTWITLEDKEITVLGLNIGTMYTFTAKTRNDAEEETDYASPIYTGTEGIPVPSGSAVIATTELNNSVTVAWNEIPGSLSYELEIDGIVKNVGNKTYYSHKDLMTGTQHTYRIRGKNLGGYSEWSEMYVIDTTSNLPLIPTNVLAKASDDTITVYWDTAQDALTYTVEIGSRQITDVKKNSATLFGLQPETAYTYKVKAVNLIGESEWTSEGTITTHFLETPRITLKQTDSNEIKIGWNKIEGATSYKIAMDADENFDVISGSELDEFASGSAITYTHENLPIKTAHVYRVCAMSADGDSAWSDAITLETLPQRPDVPTNFSGSASSDFITLMWDAVQDVIGYDIEVDGIVVENDNVTEYQYKGLNQYTTHTYRVRAVTDEIESAWSNMLTISTSGGIPDVPKNVVIEGIRGIATLNWDETDGAHYYDVKVGNTVFNNIAFNSFTHRQIELITSSSSIYTEIPYQIRAGNELGTSEWSDCYINNAIRGKIEKGKELDLGLTASNINDFSRYTLYVNYNDKALTVTDLCAYSVEKELAPGMVEGHEIEIVSFVPGHIVFRVSKIVDEGYLWTGIINNIKFNGNATGGTTLSYTAQCEKD